MAADVSSLARMLRSYEDGDGKRELVTRDLLGGGGAVPGSSTAEVDLELRVPAGWERRLDLESGRTYLHKREPNPSPPRRRHELTLARPPPPSSAFLLRNLHATSGYQSVCTLEKVRSALERAGRSDGSPSPPSPSTPASSSTKRRAEEEEAPGRESAAPMTVAGCPVCLLYVLVSAAEPRCPRCGAHVPVHDPTKKRPKFDLNSPSEDGPY